MSNVSPDLPLSMLVFSWLVTVMGCIQVWPPTILPLLHILFQKLRGAVNFSTPLIGADFVGCCNQHHEADTIHEVPFLEFRFKALTGLAASTFLSDPSDHHVARYQASHLGRSYGEELRVSSSNPSPTTS